MSSQPGSHPFTHSFNPGPLSLPPPPPPQAITRSWAASSGRAHFGCSFSASPCCPPCWWIAAVTHLVAGLCKDILRFDFILFEAGTETPAILELPGRGKHAFYPRRTHSL